MVIGILTVQFRLHGCRSLKEKRHRLSGLRQKYGRLTHFAVCESGSQDDHRFGEWSFVAVGSDAGFVTRVLSSLESELEQDVDAEIIDISVDIDD
ncbi:MAG: DUF503 domain-containing protein [Acidobacteria bacterium]|nr:DUF503 domain-containing protein [Acidobacteriota bacterium]